MMFFTDPGAAVAEMRRVLRPTGSVAVATWASLQETPGYAAMVDLLREMFGEPHAQALTAPYSMGSSEQLRTLMGSAFDSVEVERHDGRARFASIDDWVHTDVRGWTLADMIDDDEYEQLLSEARRQLAEFVRDDGRVEFAAPALIATAKG